MIQRLVIYFFGFFLVSRFFSEVLLVLPKWVDIVDIPFIALLVLISFFKAPNNQIDLNEHKYFVRAVLFLISIMVISSLINYKDFFEPAAILFAIGFLEGPLLFICLNKIVENIELFVSRINKFLLFFFLINVAVVIFIDLPRFISTRNPDVMSGTYGLNAYQFSLILVVFGGLFLGIFELHRFSRIIIILSQVFIISTFLLLQFRAALPFLVLSYAVVLLALYGLKMIKSVVFGSIILMIAGSIFFYVISKSGIYRVSNVTMFEYQIAKNETMLKYDDWVDVLKNPISFLKYGKFKAYLQTAKMLTTSPITALLGVGPGNYLSRGFYTFSYEMVGFGRMKKGVQRVVNKFFGLSRPRFTSVSMRYIGPIRSGAILGTYQFSNPNSSILAPIAEIGLIGGGIIIATYIYLLIKSLELMRLAKKYVLDFLPIAAALVAGIVYLLGLAFLDNYWEVSRTTLPVWLLFWATNAGINLKLQAMENSESEK